MVSVVSIFNLFMLIASLLLAHYAKWLWKNALLFGGIWLVDK